jgi:hypothetical protein
MNMDEANIIVESIFITLNEDLSSVLKAAVGSPVKFIKIKRDNKW